MLKQILSLKKTSAIFKTSICAISRRKYGKSKENWWWNWNGIFNSISIPVNSNSMACNSNSNSGIDPSPDRHPVRPAMTSILSSKLIFWRKLTMLKPDFPAMTSILSSKLIFWRKLTMLKPDLTVSHTGLMKPCLFSLLWKTTYLKTPHICTVYYTVLLHNLLLEAVVFFHINPIHVLLCSVSTCAVVWQLQMKLLLPKIRFKNISFNQPLNIKTFFPGMGISIKKIRQSWDWEWVFLYW